MQLSIIIISYNTKELTLACVRSVIHEKKSQVIVVDNNSSDGSVQALIREFGSTITLIQNSDNTGFARANNQGVAAAKGKYVLLLNSDTLVHPHAIESMMSALESCQQFGAISCTLLNRDKSFQPQGGSLPTLLNLSVWWLWPFNTQQPFLKNEYQDSAPYDEKVPIIEWGWIGGTALLTTKELYTAVDGLDEAIFMYAEDIDFCIKIHKLGRKIGIVPNAIITHYGNASGSKGKAVLGEINGLLYIFSKYHSSIDKELLRLIFSLGCVLRFFLFGILNGNKEASALYRRALLSLWS